ncbi:MAG: PEP-CTERM/exosortase system-associated acyltransferase [Gammaproteobacteria bacterium]|nr:PEP-CTERM/exosortase system-associated acyltransferase [Gammaproteobacteria bacterium]
MQAQTSPKRDTAMSGAKFQTVLCDTDESCSIHYQIRYQVYCRETGFEDPEEFADGKETDSHDRHSVHFAARDPRSGSWIAAMRLVFAANGRLPLEAACSLEPVPEKLSERRSLVELSRLCVLESHRRHNRDRSLGLKVIDGNSGAVTKNMPDPRYPEIMLGFIRATFAWSRKHNVSHCYFLVNNALARTLKRLNIMLTPVGDAIEHRGMRTPYVVDLRESERRMKQKLAVFRELERKGEPYVIYSELSKNAELKFG